MAKAKKRKVKNKVDKTEGASNALSRRPLKGLLAVVLMLLALIFFLANTGQAGSPQYTYEVIDKIPHDPKSFTQGFLYHDGFFYEGTGQRGKSSVSRIDPAKGTILERTHLDKQYFGEGLAFSRGVLVQLTWQAHKAFVYNHETLEVLRELEYDSEGWGLTHDGQHYIMSDGTHQITFRDGNFNTVRTIEVMEGEDKISELNELEYINGEIWSNVWRTWSIVRIDPITGKVLGRINLKGLIKRGERNGMEDYLNGIAYDKTSDSIYVTGKLFSYIYKIKVKLEERS